MSAQQLFDYINVNVVLKNDYTNSLQAKYDANPSSLTPSEIRGLSQTVAEHMYLKAIFAKGLTADPSNELLLLAKSGFDYYGYIPDNFYKFVENWQMYI